MDSGTGNKQLALVIPSSGSGYPSGGYSEADIPNALKPTSDALFSSAVDCQQFFDANPKERAATARAYNWEQADGVLESAGVVYDNVVDKFLFWHPVELLINNTVGNLLSPTYPEAIKRFCAQYQIDAEAWNRAHGSDIDGQQSDRQ